ncbi:hypothetical protein F4680DRAFT_416581 [Xylaria scruposa]|nr:hypothetical protein F4680DRAFT_416581 [Xylaria scruposa]
MSNSTIGWQTGPTERGTLTLVYGCLITIFTCTWTVLHLNVPGVNDRWWEIAMRKTKWMIITILLPEFIFAKAVCDLRLALKNLHEFGVALKRDNLKWTVSCKNIKHTYNWQVDYGPQAKLLYQILGLTPPDDPSRPVEKIAKHAGKILIARSPPDAEGVRTQPNTTQTFHTTQLWTLTHAYFANMGGLIYSDLLFDFIYDYLLTGAELSLDYSWIDHPLQGLVLGKGDIEDKSKADWLLKCLTVLQVTWLVLTGIVRGVNGLPVTQLEIATIAFSISAIATYAANWWKPKDVSQPIRIPKIATKNFKPNELDITITQSFTLHLTDFAKAKRNVDNSHSHIFPPCRIQNDDTWIEGNVPLIYTIMAAFSFLFGGIHIIAWNFEFPSLAELMLWRASSLTSTILPLIIIMLNLYLNYLTTTTDNNLKLSCYEMLKSLGEPPRYFYDTLMDLSSSLDAKGDRNAGFVNVILMANTFSKTPEKFKAQLDRMLGYDSYRSLDEIEKHLGNTSRYWIPIKRRICSIIEIWEHYKSVKKRCETYPKVSKFLTIGGSILYIISRLIILVLLFTSLRAVPKGVYDNTPWTRFLPSFS